MGPLAPEKYSWQPQPGSRKNWDYWLLIIGHGVMNELALQDLRQFDYLLLFVSPLCVFCRQTRHFVARCRGIQQVARPSFLSWGRIKEAFHLGRSANAYYYMLHAHEELQKRILRNMGLDAMEIQGVKYWVLEARHNTRSGGFTRNNENKFQLTGKRVEYDMGVWDEIW